MPALKQAALKQDDHLEKGNHRGLPLRLVENPFVPENLSADRQDLQLLADFGMDVFVFRMKLLNLLIRVNFDKPKS